MMRVGLFQMVHRDKGHAGREGDAFRHPAADDQARTRGRRHGTKVPEADPGLGHGVLHELGQQGEMGAGSDFGDNAVSTQGDRALARKIGHSLGAILVEQHTGISSDDVKRWLPAHPRWPELWDSVEARLPGVVQETDLLREIRGVIRRCRAEETTESGDRVLVHGDLGLHNIAIEPSTESFKVCSTTMVRLGQIDTTTSATLFLTNNKRTY
jgi:hypothetical protein